MGVLTSFLHLLLREPPSNLAVSGLSKNRRFRAARFFTQGPVPAAEGPKQNRWNVVTVIGRPRMGVLFPECRVQPFPARPSAQRGSSPSLPPLEVAPKRRLEYCASMD